MVAREELADKECGKSSDKLVQPRSSDTSPRPECRRNEFADAVEESDPKFAAWMRKHGKQAVLKDEEVDRLERARRAPSGASHEDVMESLYGRWQPKPKEASFNSEERIKMRAVEEAKKLAAKTSSEQDRAWKAFVINPQLGVECQDYKWQQNQSYVEVYCRIPNNVPLKEIEVVLLPAYLRIVIGMKPIVQGELYSRVKQEESTWYVEADILHVILLKQNRRGHYQNGSTNADTFWPSVLRKRIQGESLEVDHPPSAYYSSFWESSGTGRLK